MALANAELGYVQPRLVEYRQSSNRSRNDQGRWYKAESGAQAQRSAARRQWLACDAPLNFVLKTGRAFRGHACRKRAYFFEMAWWLCAKLGPPRASRERVFIFRHCERKRSNPGPLARKLDCFVASLLVMTSVYPLRSAAKRGKGTCEGGGRIRRATTLARLTFSCRRRKARVIVSRV
jgi:hypothetical protein